MWRHVVPCGVARGRSAAASQARPRPPERLAAVGLGDPLRAMHGAWSYPAVMPSTQPQHQPLTPGEAYELLLAGNRRFIAGTPEHPNQDAARRTEIAPSQSPFAVLFGCSDSRL